MATKAQEQLTLEGAKIAMAASEQKAKQIGVDMNIAVVDASTHLLHFSRMPNAKITSISSESSHFHGDAVSSMSIQRAGSVMSPQLCRLRA